jgi:hypothetical protein
VAKISDRGPQCNKNLLGKYKLSHAWCGRRELVALDIIQFSGRSSSIHREMKAISASETGGRPNGMRNGTRCGRSGSGR